MDFEDGMGIDLAYRAHNYGHKIRYWHKEGRYGKGVIPLSTDWKLDMDWAELIVCTGNADYPGGFRDYFNKTYPIFGTNKLSAELELDREKGQQILDAVGIETIPYVIVDSLQDAAAHLVKTKKPCVIKPWGGEGDKSMTCVCNSVDEGLFTLEKWKKSGKFKGQLMLQEKVKGVEVGISAFFGPGGWSEWKEESFEHKKFLTGDLGQNTGEMGTVIQHSKESRLFDEILDKLTDKLHLLKYVGDCSVNCIIVGDKPLPLEFTMRLGWPDFCIRQAVLKGDPVQWMADLVYGRDTFEPTADCAVGVVMVHGDFPNYRDKAETWSGYPMYGVTSDLERHLHWQHIQWGKSPMLVGNSIRDVPGLQTAGVYPVVVTGTGMTVRRAVANTYEHVKRLCWPSNMMYRVDIGERLEEGLLDIQEHGYCLEIDY